MWLLNRSCLLMLIRGRDIARSNLEWKRIIKAGGGKAALGDHWQPSSTLPTWGLGQRQPGQLQC